MKLKEYIDILSTFDQDVEVVKLVVTPHRKVLKKVTRLDIFKPHVHFVRDDKGKESLIESYVI